MKRTERDKILLDMGITAGSPSEAWKIILSMVGDESSEGAQDKIKEFEELTFTIGKQSIRDYVARVKALVIKLEQHSVRTSKQETKRRILNSLPSDFNVENKMFLMIEDIEPDELGEALARINDQRLRTHALATDVKPQGNGQRCGGRARGARGGRGSGGNDKCDDRGHHQQQ